MFADGYPADLSCDSSSGSCASAGTLSNLFTIAVGDATRQAFDKRYAEPAVESGRKAAADLSTLAQQLASALAALNQ